MYGYKEPIVRSLGVRQALGPAPANNIVYNDVMRSGFQQPVERLGQIHLADKFKGR